MEGAGEFDFLRVYVDGAEIATQAASFDASSPQITLSECEFCYHCGIATIAARKIDDHSVVWFTNPNHGRDYEVETEELRIFDLTEYETALKSKTTELPELSTEDMCHILSLEQFPDWKEFLYCLPEMDGDETGADTMGLIAESISKRSFSPSVQSISEFETITFGFDIDKLLETKIDFAMRSSEIVFRFRSFPNIPIWLKIEPSRDDFVAVKRHLENAR